MTNRNVQLGDSEIHVLDSGTGPALLFVHGFPLDHRMWREQARFFRDSCRVICPDLPGFGLSRSQRLPDSTSQISMGQMANNLVLLLDELGIGQVVFCGLSMGGYIGWEFWRRHAERLLGLVACDTRVIADTPKIARGRRVMAEGLLRASGSDRARKIELYADTLLPKLFAGGTVLDSGLPVEAREMVANTAGEALAAAQLAMARRRDFTDELARIEVPVLVVCGAEDQISTAGEMQRMASRIPGSSFCEIPAAGHLAPWEQPAAFNRCLAEFLDRVL